MDTITPEALCSQHVPGICCFATFGMIFNIMCLQDFVYIRHLLEDKKNIPNILYLYVLAQVCIGACVYRQFSFLRRHPFWVLIGSVTETNEEARPQESVCLCLPVLKLPPCPAYSWILGVEFRSSCFCGKHFIDSAISSGLKTIIFFNIMEGKKPAVISVLLVK